jgi:heptosyltransferase-2
LIEAIALLDHSHAILSNDSGLMHAACALNKKVLVIYGSTSDKFTPPLSDKAKSINVNHLPCRPCFKRECPLKHTNCLNDLKPNKVIFEFQRVLNIV